MWRWEYAILETVNAHGGDAYLADIYSTLEEKFPLTESDLKRTIYSGRPAYQHQVRSHISNLCQKGFLLKLRRGCYSLTFHGKERFLNELAEYEPESELLSRGRLRPPFVISVEVERLEEGGYLATCPGIQGCLAEGDTVAESLNNLEDVAAALLKIRREDGLPFPDGLETYRQGRTLRAELLVRPPE